MPIMALSNDLGRWSGTLGVTSSLILCFLRHLDEDAAFATLKAAEPYLLKYLQDQDAEIRKGALMGLRGSQDDQTLAAVAKLFAQEAEEVPLHHAFEFLQRAGSKAEPAFLDGLKSARPPTRLKSIVGLKGIKSEKALAAIGEMFLGDCPPDVRGTAGDYLKAQGLRPVWYSTPGAHEMKVWRHALHEFLPKLFKPQSVPLVTTS